MLHVANIFLTRTPVIRRERWLDAALAGHRTDIDGT
jgi:hypothetical protein